VLHLSYRVSFDLAQDTFCVAHRALSARYSIRTTHR
jgi:hypothetical protein